MRLILSVILALFFYTSVYPSEFWPRTRDDYYRENVHSDYYDLYYSDHYDNLRMEMYNWTYDWDRTYEQQQIDRDDWWDEEYRDWLEGQGVDEGITLGW